MKFELSGQQRVLLRRNNVIFCHKHFQFITMNVRQFENFNDMMKEMTMLRLKRYPLGGQLWLHREHDSFRLTSPDTYFLFYPRSWQRYKIHVHRRIYNILRQHERAQGDQYDAHNESEFKPRPRRLTSYSRRQALSRSTRDVTTTYEQRQERAAISKGYDSNPRSHLQSRSREDADRDSSVAMSTNGDSVSDIEHGSGESINEPLLS